MESGMHERRKIQRHNISVPAWVFLKDLTVADCIVRALTNAGAGIVTGRPQMLSDRPHLTFDGGHIFRQRYLVWRQHNRLGLE